VPELSSSDRIISREAGSMVWKSDVRVTERIRQNLWIDITSKAA